MGGYYDVDAHAVEFELVGWSIVETGLPVGMLGATDHTERVIYLKRGLSRAQRRAVLAHELAHAERGRQAFEADGVVADERVVCQTTSARLVPFDALLAAVRWTTNLGELADELNVDRATVKDRLRSLTSNERQQLRSVGAHGAPVGWSA